MLDSKLAGILRSGGSRPRPPFLEDPRNPADHNSLGPANYPRERRYKVARAEPGKYLEDVEHSQPLKYWQSFKVAGHRPLLGSLR